MTQDDIIRIAREAGFVDYELDDYTPSGYDIRYERFASLVAAAERKVIMDSLQKQADLATDALDRRWALEMIAAVAARSSK